MSFSEPLVNQVKIFLLSVGMGVLLCGVYILVQSVFAFLGKARGFQLSADLLFCVAFALLSFFFMIFYNNGRVRLHLVIGEALGFAAFYVSVGKHIFRALLKGALVANRAAALFLLPFRRVWRAFVNLLVRFTAFLKEVFCRKNSTGRPQKSFESCFGKKLLSKLKKVDKIGKIHLQNPDKSV